MQLEISLIISQILAFLVMLWVLKKFAWKPLLKILNERKENIQSTFHSLEDQKKEVERLKELYTHKLGKIAEEEKQKIAEAVDLGNQMAKQIHEEAHAQAKAILAKAQQDIENEWNKAQTELKNKLIEIVIQATKKLIDEKIDAKKDQELIGEFIDEVKAK